MAVNTVTFTLNGQEYTLSYDSASGSYKGTITAPGTTSWAQPDHKYKGSVKATDTAGNAVTADTDDFPALALRVLEKVAPVITPVYPSSDAFLSNAAPTITWNVTDSGSGVDPDTISIQVDIGAVVTSGITKVEISGGYQCAYTPSALSDGAHSVVLNASDNDGNSASQVTLSFTVDTVPPILDITSPADGLITNNASLQLAGTTNDANSGVSTVTYAWNGGEAQQATVTGGTITASLTIPREGENTLTITATDQAGKTTTVTRTVTLDTVAPVITAVTLAPNPVDAGKTYVITVTVTD